jgi:ParB family transcriptional regulator, chromosome partitioning protein
MALGKSLGNILGDYFGENPDLTIDASSTIQQIPIKDIKVSEFQTRSFFEETAIDSLASSIRDNGLIHPILLIHSEEGFNLISGERRFRAVKSLGWGTIPAIVKNKDSLTDAQKTMLMAVENLQREGLSPIEQARTYKILMTTKKITEQELAEIFNVTYQYVRNYMRLLNTSEDVQNALGQKLVTEGQVRGLTLLSHADQNIILKQIIEKKLTVKEIEKLIQNYRTPKPIPLSRRVSIHELSPQVVTDVERFTQYFPAAKIKMQGNQESGKIVISW